MVGTAGFEPATPRPPVTPEQFFKVSHPLSTRSQTIAAAHVASNGIVSADPRRSQ